MAKYNAPDNLSSVLTGLSRQLPFAGLGEVLRWNRGHRETHFAQRVAGALTMVRDRGFEPLTPTVSR
jgi:hypothetical protein